MFALAGKLRWITLSLVVMLLVIASGCASASLPEAEESRGFAPPAPEMPAPVEVADSSGGGIPGAPAQQPERIVIKNANLTIVVSNPSTSLDKISRMAEEMGGFVVSANLYKDTLPSGAEVPRATITVRVPAERLNEALERIKEESEQEPLNEGINSQDVTSDYVDLQSRLKNLEATEAQLSEIMASATKTEDVLAVYNQLVQVREQIEVIKGQIKYYEESAALSAISVDLMADEAVQPLQIGGWQPMGVMKSALEALIKTLQFLVNAILVIVIYVLPVALVIYLIFILPISLVWRAWKRRRKNRNQAGAPPAIQAGEPEDK